MTCESCAYGPFYAGATFDYWRVASAKNAFGVKNWYLNSFTGPFAFTGSDLRANDTASREGVFAANGPVKLWSDQDNGAAADRHVRIYHGSKVAPQVDFDGSTNTAKLDLDSDGTVDYTVVKPAAACASGMNLAVNASGQVVCMKNKHDVEQSLQVASCAGGAASPADVGRGGSASYACDLIGTYPHPEVTFPDVDDSYVSWMSSPPADWNGTYTVAVRFHDSATSGAVVFYVKTSCGLPNTVFPDPSQTATATVTTSSTGGGTTAANLTGTLSTSCAGQPVFFVFGRAGGDSGDTMTATATLDALRVVFGVN